MRKPSRAKDSKDAKRYKSLPLKIARSIADDLFTDGQGEKALRLIMERTDGSHGAGWCRIAVIERVESMLLKYLASLASLARKKS